MGLLSSEEDCLRQRLSLIHVGVVGQFFTDRENVEALQKIVDDLQEMYHKRNVHVMTKVLLREGGGAFFAFKKIQRTQGLHDEQV